jgi:hypothetical protein
MRNLRENTPLNLHISIDCSTTILIITAIAIILFLIINECITFNKNEIEIPNPFKWFRNFYKKYKHEKIKQNMYEHTIRDLNQKRVESYSNNIILNVTTPYRRHQ